jgi:iron complex transport system substrate-binding protein
MSLARRNIIAPTLALVLVCAVLLLRQPRAARANLVGPDCDCNSTQHERIASVSLSSDYLLLRLVEANKLTSVSWVVDWPDYSPDAGKVPASIPRVQGQAETIVALQSDFAVVAPFSTPNLADELRQLGVRVFELSATNSLEAIINDVERLGNCLGAAARARPWATQLRSRVAAVERRGAARHRIRVLVVDAGFAQAKGTLVDDLLNKLGAINPARATGLEGGILLDAERLLNWHPDIVFVAVPGTHVERDATGVLASLSGYTQLSQAAAYQPRRVVGIPLSQLDAVSPLAVDALEAMDQAIAEVVQ